MDALSRKIYLDLPKPKIGDVMADKERLLNGLYPLIGYATMSYQVLRRDYTVFRNDDWKVTATVVWNGNYWQVTQIESGDTTNSHFGLTVDLGSTMMAMQLVDLNDGQVLAQDSEYNPQIKYGEDILSRIFYAKDNQERLNELQSLTVNRFVDLMNRMEKMSGVSCENCSVMVIGGNTTMIHFLLAIDAFAIFMTPFAPIFNNSGFMASTDLNLPFNGMVYCIPSIANYLGGDIISGLLDVDMVSNDKLCLYMDIGTNGEMVIGNKDFLVAGAGAAGPALEGGISKYGMRATDGAVDSVSIADNVLSTTTIGNAPAKGICGSGIVDLLAQMLLNGWMDKAGNLDFDKSDRIIKVGHELAVVYANSNESAAGNDLFFSESDIIAFRDTKAAANTMVALLLEATHVNPMDIEIIYTAGGFGQYVDLESAITIGMYPDLPREKFSSVGNGSIKGAYRLLTERDKLAQIKHITEKIYYLEFAAFPDFISKMMAASFFPHTDLDSYPSVMAKLADMKNNKSK